LGTRIGRDGNLRDHLCSHQRTAVKDSAIESFRGGTAWGSVDGGDGRDDAGTGLPRGELLEAPRIAKLCKNKHISSRALSGSVAGLFLSYWWDLPSGAAIVCTFGALLILVSLLAFCRNRFQRLDDTP